MVLIMTDIIYNENCLEGLEKLADNSIDLMCTDPPYCVGATSNGTKASPFDNNLIVPFFKELFIQWRRVLKDGGHIYINTDWRTYPVLYPTVIQYFVQRNLLIWNKDKYMGVGNWYRYNYEMIIFATNGESKRTFSAAERDIFNIPLKEALASKRVHRAQKPVELCEKMILNSSREGDVVLDCFMGSGTTAVACINTGRHFIGFETEKKYFDIANKRIDEARKALI